MGVPAIKIKTLFPVCFPVALQARIKQWDSIAGALGIFRLASWLLTSVFYMLGAPADALGFKLAVVVVLLVEAIFAQGTYCRSRSRIRILQGLVIAETVGIGLLLLPTGGLESPFIWYAMNPILIAAAHLAFLWCWGILAALAGVIFTVSYFVRGDVQAALLHLKTQADLLLIFTLITLGVQLLTRLAEHSNGQTKILAQQRADLQRSIEHIASLYQLVEVVSTRDKVQEVLELFAGYTRTLAGAYYVVLRLVPREGDEALQALSGPEDGLPWWETELMGTCMEMLGGTEIRKKEVEIGGQEFFILQLPVQSPNRCHGHLVSIHHGNAEVVTERMHLLRFLADLAAVALERCQLEELHQQVLVSEEQNRIANEIHDGVAQYLFSIACGCHALRASWSEYGPEKVEQQLAAMEITAQRAAQELRDSIYRLSTRRQGKEVFVSSVKSYLEGLAALNNIVVNVEVEGSEEVVSPALRKALYRIIREASGNAVRHANCQKLSMRLQMAPSYTLLEIEDDGSGFVLKLLEGDQWGQGLGIANMKQLAAGFNGEVTIRSTRGRGTVVRCEIPKKTENKGGIVGEVGGNR